MTSDGTARSERFFRYGLYGRIQTPPQFNPERKIECTNTASRSPALPPAF